MERIDRETFNFYRSKINAIYRAHIQTGIKIDHVGYDRLRQLCGMALQVGIKNSPFIYYHYIAAISHLSNYPLSAVFNALNKAEQMGCAIPEMYTMVLNAIVIKQPNDNQVFPFFMQLRNKITPDMAMYRVMLKNIEMADYPDAKLADYLYQELRQLHGDNQSAYHSMMKTLMKFKSCGYDLDMATRLINKWSQHEYYQTFQRQETFDQFGINHERQRFFSQPSLLEFGQSHMQKHACSKS